MRAREQIYVLLKDAKWIIAVSLLLAVVLGVPDQIKELYRIEYSDSITAQGFVASHYLLLHVPVILIGFMVWLGANQIAFETRTSIEEPTTAFEIGAQWLPVVLGALPLLGCAFGLYQAVPVRLPIDEHAMRLVGSPWEHYSKLFDSVSNGLRIGAAIQIAVLLLLASQGRRIAERLNGITVKLNQRCLGRWSGFGATVLLIVAITATLVIYPVTLPQWIGAFFVLMLFAICVVLAVVNLTLVSMRHKLPIISVLCLIAALFSVFDWTDNHWVRQIGDSDPTLQKASERVVADEFDKWLKSRPDRAHYPGEYPVYVVAAQGGGIYAAYQTAIFLARMQDVCPAFRHHLFAISSVSGGSIGAAAFVAALDALDRNMLNTVPAAPAAAGAAFDPCPQITTYREQAVLPNSAWEPGPLEKAVRKTLARDFLTPLAAAALFPDFTQRFLPFPVGPFDRARALEYTMEAGGRSIIEAPGRRIAAGDNAFESSVLKLWNAEQSIPALLINTTDAGSGRRFLIAPFKMVESTSQKKFGALVDYQFWDGKKARDLRLSTAAGMSARFPWVTPAASVEDARLPNAKKVKLVDGGYVDNSGVETVLNLKETLDRSIKQEKVGLNLVVLSGGDYPHRKSFALGETMEPVRALLNTRTSRAYVAIQRAEHLFDSPLVKTTTFGGKDRSVYRPTLKKAKLETRFYELPLGWMLSNKTRSIIEDQSGRFWECTPDQSFVQAQRGLAPADCVQLLIYHELSQSVEGVAEQVAILGHLVDEDRGSNKHPDIEAIIACYRDRLSESSNKQQSFNLEQTGNMRALMTIWRRDGSGAGHDDLLAYVMATAAYESGDFQTRRESLDYTSAEKILAIWPRRFDDIPPAERLTEIEKRYVRKPLELAEKVYGGRHGNGEGVGDGWRYRGRGLAFITGKEKYQLWGDAIGVQLVHNPELIFIPEFNAKIFIKAYFAESKAAEMHGLLSAGNWPELRKTVMKAAGQSLGTLEKSIVQVGAKTKMFDACIKQPSARGPAATRTAAATQ